MLQKRSQERERTLRTLLDKINNRCDVLKQPPKQAQENSFAIAAGCMDLSPEGYKSQDGNPDEDQNDLLQMIKLLKTNALDKKMSISSNHNQRYQGHQNLNMKKNNTSGVMNPVEEYTIDKN